MAAIPRRYAALWIHLGSPLWNMAWEDSPNDIVSAAGDVDCVHLFCKLHGLDPVQCITADSSFDAAARRRQTRLYWPYSTDRRARKEGCPDCRGTGKYLGLNVIEDCAMCRGQGIV